MTEWFTIPLVFGGLTGRCDLCDMQTFYEISPYQLRCDKAFPKASRPKGLELKGITGSCTIVALTAASQARHAHRWVHTLLLQHFYISKLANH